MSRQVSDTSQHSGPESLTSGWLTIRHLSMNYQEGLSRVENFFCPAQCIQGGGDSGEHHRLNQKFDSFRACPPTGAVSQRDTF